MLGVFLCTGTTKGWNRILTAEIISQHNMDKTATFMHNTMELFVNEDLPRFILCDALLNDDDATLGH